MANRRYIDFPIASTSGNTDIILIWQDGANKQTTKATFLSGLPENLADLNDVIISGLTNGQILRYDSVTGKWENTDQGNLDLNDLNDVQIVSPSNGQVLVYNSSTGKWENSSGGFVPYTGAVTTVNLGAQTIQAGQFVKVGGTASQFLKANGSVDSTAYGTGSVTSVALTMPSAFNVANSPITTAGTLAVTGAGTVGQYIRGDGSLADFPESSGGGSSVSYYLNGSISQGTIGGVAYKELNKVPILGAGTNFTINADGYIAQFLTDAGDPHLIEIPGGNWNFETYFSASSSGGTPSFYVELYKYDGTTFTLIASSSSAPEFIAFGTITTPYFSSLAVPTTALTLTDRLAVRFYVTHSGRTITLHTENNTLCQIVTTFTTGLTSLNGLTAQVQNLAVGNSGTDFAIVSATATHTFNLPTASAVNRGALSSADWSTFNGKQNALTLTTTGTSGASTLIGATLNIPNYGSALSGYVPYTGATSNVDLGIYTLSSSNLIANGGFNSGALLLKQSNNAQSINLNYTTITPVGTTQLNFGFSQSSGVWKSFALNAINLTNNTNRTYVLPDADGTIALVGGAGVGTVTSVGLSSATSGVTIGSTPVTTSGTITLAIATASGSGQGLLSSTDWTTFNNKQNALTNPVTGTGTTNYLPKFTGSTTIGNSQIFDNGTNVGINTNTPLSTNLLGALTIVKSYSSDTPASTTAQTYYTNQSGLYLFGRNSGLTIVGVNNEENQIIFANTSTVAFASINTGTGSNSTGGDMYFKVGSNTEAMRIFATTRNVHIGPTPVSDNGAKLQVSGEVSVKTTEAAIGLTILGRSDDFGVLRFKNAAGSANKATIYTNPNSLVFEVGAISNALSISSTGAATFSSSVTALKYIANAQATYASITYEETFKYASSPAGIWFGNSFNSNNNVALQLRTSNDGTSVQALTLAPTGAATFSSSVTTGAPAGGTAQPWKLGTVATITPTSPNRTIEVEVNGTIYYLHAKTTNN